MPQQTGVTTNAPLPTSPGQYGSAAWQAYQLYNTGAPSNQPSYWQVLNSTSNAYDFYQQQKAQQAAYAASTDPVDGMLQSMGNAYSNQSTLLNMLPSFPGKSFLENSA